MTERLKQLLRQRKPAESKPADTNDPMIGTLLGGEYKILELLGQGAMAKVYKGKQVKLDRVVAIKGLTAVAPDIVARFEHEIKVHSKLKHVNIVEALDCVTDPRSGNIFFVMEFLDGLSLQQLVIENCGGFSNPEDLYFILNQIASALDYAHRQGVIHRDLKPANLVLVEQMGELKMKVVDFGMARLQEQFQRFTKTGHVVGSPLYMSPEQCMGKELDHRADIYAMGLVTYELVAGDAPYRGLATLYDLMRAHCNPNHRPPPILTKNGNIQLSDRLDSIMRLALETNPELRFQSIRMYDDAIKFWHQSVIKGLTPEDVAAIPIVTGSTVEPPAPEEAPAATEAPQEAESPESKVTPPFYQAPQATPLPEESQTRQRTNWRLPELVVTQREGGWGVVTGEELSYIPQCEPLIGKVLQQRFRVLGLLGEGGMSVVYRAQDLEESDKLVAVKTLKFVDADLSERFAREIALHSELRHPNIVKAIDHFKSIQGQAFFVMELLEGTILEDFLDRDIQINEFNDICSILSQLCDALEYAHDKGIIHRDLKPGNVMLVEQQGALRVKVLDFGLAKIEADLQRLTQSGILLGSPAYMSPEHCLGLPLTAQSDLYSLGVLAYEMICGRLPYDGDSNLGIIQAHCDKNLAPLPLTNFRTDLPEVKKIEEILNRMMSKDLSHRYQSVEDFRRALDSWWIAAGREKDSSPFKQRRRRRGKVESPVAEPVKQPVKKEVVAVSDLDKIVEGQRQVRFSSKYSCAEPLLDARSLRTVGIVLLTVAIFCVLGTFVWQTSRAPRPAVSTEVEVQYSSGEPEKETTAPGAVTSTAEEEDQEEEEEEVHHYTKIHNTSRRTQFQTIGK